MDTTTFTAQDVALAILNGDFDSDLTALSNAVQERRKTVRKTEAQMNALFLSPGDRVTLKGLSPKYLNGTEVEVTKINKTRACVKAVEGITTPRAAQRIGFGGFCTVPLSCVEKVDG